MLAHRLHFPRCRANGWPLFISTLPSYSWLALPLVALCRVHVAALLVAAYLGDALTTRSSGEDEADKHRRRRKFRIEQDAAMYSISIGRKVTATTVLLEEVGETSLPCLEKAWSESTNNTLAWQFGDHRLSMRERADQILSKFVELGISILGSASIHLSI